MRWRNTLVALGVLIVLLTVYYLYEVRGGEARWQAAVVESRAFGIPDESDVTSVDLRNSKGAVRIEWRGDAWEIAAPLSTPADQSRAIGLAESLKQLGVLRRMEEAGDPLALGLDPPAAIVTLESNTAGSPISLEVGAEASLGDGYYARPAGGSGVVVVGPEVGQVLGLELIQLRERRVVALRPREIQTVRLEKEGSFITLERAGPESWRMVEPYAFPADRDRVRDLLQSLTGARAEAFPGPEHSLEPAMVVTLGTGEEEQRIELSAPVEGVRLARRANGDLLEVPGSSLAELDRPPAWWKRRRVVGGTRQELESIALRSPGGDWAVERDPSGWVHSGPEPRPVEPERMERFLDGLYALQAEGHRLVEGPLPPGGWELDLRSTGGGRQALTLVCEVDGPCVALAEELREIFLLPPGALQPLHEALAPLIASADDDGTVEP